MSEEKSCACAHVKSQNVTDAPGNNTVFMIWRFNADKTACKKAFEGLCGLVINLNKTAVTRFGAASETSCVLGVGFEAWKMLDLPKPLPQELKNFEEIRGDKHIAPATGGDLHIHIRAANQAVCYDMASEIRAALKDVATCEEEICGFKYYDGRAIIGFVDGTENPQGADRDFFAKVGDEDAAYKGGSYLFVQKYIHDMSAWNAAGVAEQERVIGRSKQNDIEMSEEIKPSNSHSAAANVGDDKKVVRGNMPFMQGGETGTYFIAYASTFSTLELMLESMFIGRPRGNYDRLLDFSTAKTGALFFAPTFDMLQDYSAK